MGGVEGEGLCLKKQKNSDERECETLAFAMVRWVTQNFRSTTQYSTSQTSPATRALEAPVHLLVSGVEGHKFNSSSTQACGRQTNLQGP